MDIFKKSLLLILLAIPLSVYVLLAFYTHPVADDLIYASYLRDKGFFEIYKSLYLNTGGRYVSNALVLVNPVAFGLFRFYQLVSIFLLISTIAAAYFFIRAVTNKTVKPLHSFIGALFFCLLFITQMPDLSEGLYWYSGSVTYYLANILALFFLGTLILFLNKKFIFNKYIHGILVGLLFILVIGFNEVIMLIMALLFLVINKRTAQKQFILWLALIAIFSVAIVIMAPGNEVRAGNYENSQRFFYSLAMGLMQVARFSAHWISSASLLIVSILYISWNLKQKDSILKKESPLAMNRWFSLFLLFLIIFIAVFPPYWATGILGQHRTVNTAFFFFLIIWFVNLEAWLNYYRSRINSIVLPDKLKMVLFVFVWMDLSFNHNSYDAVTDLLYSRAKNYDTQMKERYRTISLLKESGDTKIYMDPISDKPKSIFVSEITDDPEHWLNKAYAMYFGIEDKEVMLKTDKIE